jgi:glycosyltransferase involved in cell wall biosynthesis
VQACAHAERLERAGVCYHFLPGAEPTADARPAPLIELLRGLRPDVLHVHGLDFPRPVLSLAAALPSVPIILQDHASRPPRLWRRGLQRRAFASAAGIAFCAAEQAQPFREAGVLGTHTPVYAIPESTSRFGPGDRAVARRATGLDGDPAILWVGHLDANKDPLTVLEGLSAAVPALGDAQLHCCFAGAPLHARVEARIAGDARLRGRVRLLGQVPHAHIEQLMRAADLFVLGSHREGSSFSLIEALATGLTPVVTDIPSLRALTGNGAVGELWPCGDSGALARALHAAGARVGSRSRLAIREHFDEQLSSTALGRKLTAAYRELATSLARIAHGLA